jgi:hypothetical protein
MKVNSQSLAKSHWILKIFECSDICMENTTMVRHHMAESSRPVGLEDLLSNSMQETMCVEISHPTVVPAVDLWHQSGPLVTLMWLAPWAVHAMRIAQYYELERFFQGLSLGSNKDSSNFSDVHVNQQIFRQILDF